jgi:hypothetical protein
MARAGKGSIPILPYTAALIEWAKVANHAKLASTMASISDDFVN